jgi:hypothetical protein
MNMPDMTLLFNAKLLPVKLLILLMLTSCATQPKAEPRSLQIQQQWQLQPGDEVVGHRVVGGLGDVSIELNGGKVRAPFDGEVEPYQNQCVIFSSPQIPAYLMRLCGVEQPKLGKVKQGEAIGSADPLVFAALRRLPDGKWAMVEPSLNVLERTVRKP